MDDATTAKAEVGEETEINQTALFRHRHAMETLLKNSAVSAIPKVGDIVEGMVLDKKGTRVFVELGSFGTGIIYGREYYAAQDIVRGLKPGDAVSGKVVDADNEKGYVELSLKEAGEERRWFDLQKMMQEGEAFELPVLEANRGGLILEIKGVKGFLPASHLSQQHYPRVDGGDKEKIFQELLKLVGTPLRVKVLDLDPKENKLIFTEKGQTSGELHAEFSKYKAGDVVEGEITSVVDFGAFMKFGEAGMEGLIHISEIDWTLIEDPRDTLKSGDKVSAKIIDIRGDKISLSLKQLKEDPWIGGSEKYHKGDVVKAKVTKFNPFGVFAQLDRDIHGLAHISEFGTEAKMREMLKLEEEYPFRILMIDPKEHRLSLGLIREEDKENKNRGEAGIPAADAARESPELARETPEEKELPETKQEETAEIKSMEVKPQ